MLRLPFISRTAHDEAVALLKEQIADLKAERDRMWAQLTEPQAAPTKPAGLQVPFAPGRFPLAEQLIAAHDANVETALEAKGELEQEAADAEMPGGRRSLRRGGPHARRITMENLREFHGGKKTSVMDELFAKTRDEANAVIEAGRAAAQAAANASAPEAPSTEGVA